MSLKEENKEKEDDCVKGTHDERKRKVGNFCHHQCVWNMGKKEDI